MHSNTDRNLAIKHDSVFDSEMTILFNINLHADLNKYVLTKKTPVCDFLLLLMVVRAFVKYVETSLFSNQVCFV